MRALRLAPFVWLVAAPALAHGGAGPVEHFGWTWDPAILIPLLAAAASFGTGWCRLRARSGQGGDRLRQHGLLFLFGWLTLTAALVSPLHQGGEHSFTMHMAEHELLMLVAAPLLVLARPVAIMLWAWPAPMRRTLGQIGKAPWFSVPWKAISAPVSATLLQAAALWLWHAPALFDLALASGTWHALQHLSFLVSALLFWTAMLRSDRTGANRPIAVLCLFATSIVAGALGALMALSASPWYEGYARMGMAPLGLTPTEDQQIAGLLMWVPGGLVHAIAALVLMRHILRGSPRAVAHAV